MTVLSLKLVGGAKRALSFRPTTPSGRVRPGNGSPSRPMPSQRPPQPGLRGRGHHRRLRRRHKDIARQLRAGRAGHRTTRLTRPGPPAGRHRLDPGHQGTPRTRAHRRPMGPHNHVLRRTRHRHAHRTPLDPPHPQIRKGGHIAADAVAEAAATAPTAIRAAIESQPEGTPFGIAEQLAHRVQRRSENCVRAITANRNRSSSIRRSSAPNGNGG